MLLRGNVFTMNHSITGEAAVRNAGLHGAEDGTDILQQAVRCLCEFFHLPLLFLKILCYNSKQSKKGKTSRLL